MFARCGHGTPPAVTSHNTAGHVTPQWSRHTLNWSRHTHPVGQVTPTGSTLGSRHPPPLPHLGSRCTGGSHDRVT
eukprot:3184361-Rhodomonas_salina.3